MTQKIFNEMDHLIGNKLMQINLGLGELGDFLESKNIPFDTKIREALPGEKLEDIDDVGNVLIRTALSIKAFLKEYQEIKDTWQLTTA